MKIEEFRAKYGAAFYGFLNSELGIMFLLTLQENDPGTRLVNLPPDEQRDNAVLFLGQITGWRDLILTIQNKLIALPNGPIGEVEATYEAEESGAGQGSPPSKNSKVDDTPPPAPVAAKKKRKR